MHHNRSLAQRDNLPTLKEGYTGMPESGEVCSYLMEIGRAHV